MKNWATVLLIGLTAAGCSGEPRTVGELSRHGRDGVGIDGYSPVSYFTAGEPQKGSAQFAVEHQGVKYWLTGQDQVDKFNADSAWQKLLSGAASEKVALFNPGDADRVSEARGAAASRNYE